MSDGASNVFIHDTSVRAFYQTKQKSPETNIQDVRIAKSFSVIRGNPPLRSLLAPLNITLICRLSERQTARQVLGFAIPGYPTPGFPGIP